MVIQAKFICRISAMSNAIETIDNEMICFIIFCLNCIRHGRNAMYEPGLTSKSFLLLSFLIGFSFIPTAEISRLELEFEESCGVVSTINRWADISATIEF